MSRPLPPRDVIARFVVYEPDTGVVSWLHRPGAPKQWNVRYAGKPAGYSDAKGHLYIDLCGERRSLHRVVWLLVHGVDPLELEVDHVNGVRDDNRLVNLRLATRSENRRNSRSRGLWPKGVYRNKRGRYIAQIKQDGVVTYLGSFDTPEQAARMYADWAAIAFGDFACTNR